MANSYQEQVQAATQALESIRTKVEAVDTQILTLIRNLSNARDVLKTPSGVANGLKAYSEEIKKLNNLLEKQKGQVKQYNTVRESSLKLAEKAAAEEQKKQSQMDKMFSKRQSQINAEIALEQKKQAEINKAYNEKSAKEQKSISLAQKAQKERESQISKESDLRERLTRQREKEEVQNMKQLQQASKIAKANQETLRPYRQLLEKQQQAKRSLQDLIVAQGKNSQETKRAQREYDKLTAKVNLANKATSNFAKTSLGSLVRGFRQLLGAFGVTGAIFLFARFAKEGFELAKKLDSLNFAMRTIITDEEDLIQTQFFLLDITERYGAEIVTTTERYIKFLAAAEQSNIALEDTEQIFRSVTKAAGVLGLSTEELNGTYLALEQMLSKGKVTTEELRRQLGERLPGAFGIMAKALGVTIPELDKMLKKGEVLSKDALPRFAKALEEAYKIENVENVTTLRAETSRLSNAWTKFIGGLTDSEGTISKVLSGAIRWVTALVDSLNILNTTQKKFNEQLSSKMFLNQSDYYKNLGEDAKEYALIDKQRSEESIVRLKKERDVQQKIVDSFKDYTGIAKLIRPAYRDAKAQIDKINNSIATQEGRLKAANTVLGLVPKNLEEAVSKGRTLADVLADIASAQESLKNSTKDEAPAILEQIRLLEEEKKAWEDATKGMSEYRNDRFNLSKAILEIQIEEQKAIKDNAEFSIEDRLNANRIYLEKSKELLELEREFAIKEAKGSADKIKEIEIRSANDSKKLQEEGIENTKDIFKTDFEKKVEYLDKFRQVQERLLTEEATRYQNALIEQGLSREEIEKRVNQRIEEIRKQDLENFIKNEIKKVEAIAITAANREEIAQRLADLNKMLSDLNLPDAEKIDEATKALNDFFKQFQDDFFSEAGFDFLGSIVTDFDKFKKMLEETPDNKKWAVYFDTITEIAQEAFNFIAQNKSAQFDAEYERLEKERDVALQFAGESAAAKERIEEQYQARKKAIQRREARTQKELAIFNTLINTAQAVVATLAKTPPPAGLPIAALMAAIGAAQVALIASQKVPEFFRGTMNAPEGWAKVDEKGPEIHTDRQGRIKSTGEGKANLRYLSSGDKIYKTKELYFQKELNTVLKNNDIFPYNEIMGNMPSLVVESKGLKASEMDTILGKHFARIQTNVTNIDKNGLRTYVKNQGGSTEKLNNRVTFKGYSV